MVRFGERETSKEKFYAAKKPIRICDINADNIVISKSSKTKTNFNYLIGYLDKAITPLVLIIPKMSGCIKIFKVKDGDKDKNNKLMSFRIDDEKLLEKYKAILTKIEDLNNIELNALPVYDDRYIKTKVTAFDDKVYTSFCGLNEAGNDIKCESFTFISIDSLFVHDSKYYQILKALEITSDRGLVLQIFVATMNLAPIGVLRTFGSQYIWEEFSIPQFY